MASYLINFTTLTLLFLCFINVKQLWNNLHWMKPYKYMWPDLTYSLSITWLTNSPICWQEILLEKCSCAIYFQINTQLYILQYNTLRHLYRKFACIKKVFESLHTEQFLWYKEVNKYHIKNVSIYSNITTKR